MVQGHGGGRQRPRADGGSASVELAAALPALVLVVALLLAGLAWARDGVVVAHAAGAGVRALIVGSADGAVAAARAVAGDAAAVAVTEADGWATVEVSLSRAGWLPPATSSVRAALP